MTAPEVAPPLEVGARGPTGIGTAAQIKQQPTQFIRSAKPMPNDQATTIARALLIGLPVHELPDGSFVLMQRGLVVPLPDLAAVQALVCRMSGGSA